MTDMVEFNGVMYPVAPMDPPKSDTPQMGIFVVTPAVAKSWLDICNYKNRNERATGSKGYGEDMESDDFPLTGDTLKVSRPLRKGEDPDIPEGSVSFFDGQHRARGCIKSGKPFLTGIAWGLEPDVRSKVDSGMKRAFHDNLRMNGEKHTTLLASLITRARDWEQGYRQVSNKSPMTYAQRDRYLKEHPELRRSAEIAARSVRDNSDLRPAVTALAHWVLMEVEPSYAPEFFARLGDGDMLPKEHPIMQLRRRIQRERKVQDVEGRVSDRKIMVYYIRTWNAALANNTNFVLFSPGDDNKMPEPKTRLQIEAELAKAEERAKAKADKNKIAA